MISRFVKAAAVVAASVVGVPAGAQESQPQSNWLVSVGMDPSHARGGLNLEENFVAALGRQWSRAGSGFGLRAQLSVGVEPSRTTFPEMRCADDCGPEYSHSIRTSRSLVELTGATVYTFRRNKSFRPYVLGGPALYGVRSSYKVENLVLGNGETSDRRTEWAFGATLGLGAEFRFLGRQFTVEQRVLAPHGGNFRIHPFSIGVKF